MKVLIAGGGTGGHLFPGIAVAEEFKDRALAKEIVFVGTSQGLESRIVPKEGYALRFVRTEGLVGKTFLAKIKSLLMFLVSLFDAFRILSAVRPSIVIGVGGYASVSTVFMACLKKIPTIILEQNSVPGLANRFLGRFVDAVAIAYQESISFFPKHKTYLTGNPVRKRLSERKQDAAYAVFPIERGRFTILVVGGSRGAASINNAMIEALNYLLDLRQYIQFIHQTGEADYGRVLSAYRMLNFKGVIVSFIDQMADAYALAEMVVCRAGATTLSEIAAIGKPAILIPYPFAASNHQEYNARKLVDIGAAHMILDRELNGRTLATAIRGLCRDETLRKEMQRTISVLSKEDAAAKVVDVAMSLLRK